MLCLSGFELYSRPWPLLSCLAIQRSFDLILPYLEPISTVFTNVVRILQTSRIFVLDFCSYFNSVFYTQSAVRVLYPVHIFQPTLYTQYVFHTQSEVRSPYFILTDTLTLFTLEFFFSSKLIHKKYINTLQEIKLLLML